MTDHVVVWMRRAWFVEHAPAIGTGLLGAATTVLLLVGLLIT